MVLTAIIVQCDHVNEKNERDCPEWSLAGTAPNEKGEQQVLFPGVKEADIKVGNVWAMKAPSAVLVQGQAQVPLFYCPFHSPKPAKAPEPQKQEAKPAANGSGRSFRKG